MCVVMCACVFVSLCNQHADDHLASCMHIRDAGREGSYKALKTPGARIDANIWGFSYRASCLYRPHFVCAGVFVFFFPHAWFCVCVLCV